MSQIDRQIRSLCTPAQVYFFISMISILGILSQNVMDSNTFRVGIYSTQSPISNFWFFISKVIGVLIWTFLLNYLCNSGWKDVAWFLVLLPILVMFIVLGVFHFALCVPNVVFPIVGPLGVVFGFSSGPPSPS